MQAEPEWSVVFYLDENDKNPIGEFLGGLDLKTQARFAWSIEQLRLRNIQAKEPLVRHIEGKLWELREESQTNIFQSYEYSKPDSVGVSLTIGTTGSGGSGQTKTVIAQAHFPITSM